MIPAPAQASVTGVLAQVLWSEDEVVVTNLAEHCKDGLGPHVERALARLRTTALGGSDDVFFRFIDDRLKLWQAGNGSLLQSAPSDVPSSAPRSLAHQGRPGASSAGQRHPNLRPTARNASAADVRPLAGLPNIAMSALLEPEAPPPTVRAKPTLPPLEAGLLVERAVPMRRLQELVTAGHKTVVISGIPGAGKRTLAMQLGHRLLDGDFPGGRKLVAAVRDEDRVQDAVLQLWDELVGTTPSFSNPAVVGERLRDALSSRGRMLFILEDVRSSAIARALRQALPQDALIVITSEATHLAADMGAQGCHLEGMLAEEARELFARFLDRSPADLQDGAWLDELVAEVEGHPLCLQIAARRLRRCPDPGEWPATAIELRNIARSGLMMEKGSESGRPELSLDNIVGRILWELPEEVREKAWLLGAMAPGVAFDNRGAAALWEVNEAEAEKVLANLVEVGVLTAVRSRAGEPSPGGADGSPGEDSPVPAWRQPAPIRGFCLHSLKNATESLSPEPGLSPWTKAARRHSRHYVEGIRSGRYRIAATLPQLRHAMDWALDASDVPVCAELFDAFMQPRVCMFVARELLTWVRRLPRAEPSGKGAQADLLARLFVAIASLMGAAVDSEDRTRRIDDVLAYCDGTLEAIGAAQDRPFRMFLLAMKSRALCARAAFTNPESNGDLAESMHAATRAWELQEPDDDATLRAFVAFSLADSERLIGMTGSPLPDDRQKRMIEAYDIAIEGWRETGALVSLVRSCRALALTQGLSVAEAQGAATWERALKDLRTAIEECGHEDDRPMRGLIGLCLAQALVARATNESGDDSEATAQAEAPLREASKVCTDAIACLDRRMMPLPRSIGFFIRAVARFLQTIRTGQRQHAVRALGDLREADTLLNAGGPGTTHADMLVLWARIAVFLAFQETDDGAGIARLEESVDAIERALQALSSAAESFAAAHYLQMIAGTILVISRQRDDLLAPTFTSAKIVADAPATGGEERTQAIYVKLDMLMRLKDFPGEDARARLEEALQTVDTLQDALPEGLANETSAMLALMRAAILYERGRKTFASADANYAQVRALADQASSLLADDPANVVCEAAHLWRMIAQRASSGGFALGHAGCALQTLLDRTNYLDSLANRGPQLWYPLAAACNCIDALLSPISGTVAPGLRAQLLLLKAGLQAEAAIAAIPTNIHDLQNAGALAEEACRLLDQGGNVVEESIARLAKMNLVMTAAALGHGDRRAALQQVEKVCDDLCQRLDPATAPQLWLSLNCRQSASLLALAALPNENRQERIALALRALWAAFQRLTGSDSNAVNGARAALQELRAMGADGFDDAWQSLQLGKCPDWLSADDPIVRDRTFVVALDRFVETREDAGRDYSSVEKWRTAVEAGTRLQLIAERPEHRDRMPTLARDLASTHVGLGEALEWSGQLEEAAKEFDRAEKVDPADPDIRKYGIDVLTKAGRLREARVKLLTCERLSGRLEWYQEAHDRLVAAERSTGNAARSMANG